MGSPHGTRGPSPWVERFAPRIPREGVVLDLASGSGRHARYLVHLGYRVVAADVDVSRIADLESDQRIEVFETDLQADDWPWGDRRFDGVVVTNYLHRPTLAHLGNTLRPGGVLIYETFAKGHEAFGRPTNPDYLLNPGELLSAFASQLMVVAYELAVDRQPKPAKRQRICAVNREATGAHALSASQASST